MSECRESLEQLEGFQNQELAKVKHMLLSAETALELEKQERLRLRDQLEESKKERYITDQSLSENTFKHNQDATTNTVNPDEASKNENELSKVLYHDKLCNDNQNGGSLLLNIIMLNNFNYNDFISFKNYLRILHFRIKI